MEALEQVQLLVPDFVVAWHQDVDNQAAVAEDMDYTLYLVLTAVVLLEGGTEYSLKEALSLELQSVVE